MIRGAIENVTRNRVYGWIWSPDATVKGRTILAFLDDVCIGAGKVEEFRQDLKDAGLGDGQAGFNFDLTYPNPADAPRVILKLEGSDVVLIQKRARIMPPGAGASPARAARQQPSLSSLQWMRARGWLSQSDYDFLRFFRQLGVYERSLVVPQERPERGDPQLLDPIETARTLLLLHRMEEAEVRREALGAPRDWRRLAEQQEAAAGPGAMFAMWSRNRARIPVVEGSHVQGSLVAPDAEPPAGVDYAVGPDRLLFLDGRCVLGPTAAFPQGGVEVFYLAT
ncbi:hypothetical protein [Falsiroseomonas oryzae]|uniref:hypothetical protein n=1 Tax=Falsiroseomonas oryzae TaxID=2766473 RepID=UPI0022EB1958|nr:hypothetical protein [Roseomonas sp. MO-31]